MSAIQGSSEKEIPDVEYDEFKQYETTKEIISITPQAGDGNDKEIVTPKDGQMLISDMTIDQLRNAVVNLVNKNKMLETVITGYKDSAMRIEAIWSNPKQIKARLKNLKNRR